MHVDRYGTPHSATCSHAIAAFEEAVHAVLTHRPNTGSFLEKALTIDPALVAGHSLKGFANLILAREELLPIADEAKQEARAAMIAKGRTPAECALIDALDLALGGRFRAAAERLDTFLATDPRALLHIKIAQALRFMVGDAAGMLSGTRLVLPAWSEDDEGFGYLLGCYAFALEEVGEFAGAEQNGRRAVALAPDDAWGLHAVGHVYEMRGSISEGIAWIEGARPAWKGCNNFSFHMAWHLALFHLEAREHSRVLDLYDAEVCPVPTDDFRDMANAVSLLWRLELEGVAVGDRWSALRDIAKRRRKDTTLIFAALHNLIALVASGDHVSASELVEAIAARSADHSHPDQSHVIDSVGRELADLILSFYSDEPRPTLVPSLVARVHALGGSQAQRDVFVRSLVAAAADRGDRAALEQVLAMRRRMKVDDRFTAELLARFDQRVGLPLSV